MKLFHLTATANVSSIQVSGIIPNANGAGFSSAYAVERDDWRKEVVWLTDNPEYIAYNHAGIRSNLSILEIDTTDLPVTRRTEPTYHDENGNDVEFLFYGCITPDRIISVSEFDKT